MDELLNIIENGEGYTVEFKANVNSDLGKEIVAFANASGGTIYIGISDDGKVIRANDINLNLSKIQNIAQSCDPKPEIEVVNVQNIIVIKIFEGTEKPYRCSTGFYLRVGANSQKMATRQIVDFIQQEGRIKFDELSCPRFNFHKDFDSEKFTQFLRLAKISRSIPIKSMLSNLNLLYDDSNNIVTNACALFFAQKPYDLIPQSSIVSALYKGNDKAEILDRKEFNSDILSNVENAMLFLKRQLNNRIIIKDLQREEQLELPEVALREAIINAVTHRDYFEKGTNVMIEIYDNRVEITNFGGLPKGLSMSDFGKRSLPRNPIIASLLLRVGYIEKMGTGISRMRNEMKKAKLKSPDFQITSFFTVIFYREPASKVRGENLLDFGMDSERFSERFSEKFRNDAIKILQLLEKNPHYTAAQLAIELQVTNRTIENYLSRLKKANIIIRKGPKLGGYWEILK